MSEVDYPCYRVGHSGSIRVADKTFRGPNVRADKVALQILQSLPKRLEEAERGKERTLVYAEMVVINGAIEGTNMTVSNYSERFHLQVEFTDKMTMMVAVDYLQDGGFTQSTTLHPETDESAFHLRWAKKAVSNLSQEERFPFLQKMIDNLSVEERKILLEELFKIPEEV